jgi:hypothetical protein
MLYKFTSFICENNYFFEALIQSEQMFFFRRDIMHPTIPSTGSGTCRDPLWVAMSIGAKKEGNGATSRLCDGLR